MCVCVGNRVGLNGPASTVKVKVWVPRVGGGCGACPDPAGHPTVDGI